MVKIVNIEKRFKNKSVLKGVSLDIPARKTMVIIGQSGCGKTVLLKSIIGLVKPDKGEIFIDGDDITKLTQNGLYTVRKKMGMLFQGAALFDSMTVEENIGLPLRYHMALSDNEIRQKVDEKLRLVGLSGIGEKKPAELSGGMKKRVGLARALIMDPKLILYDEPTTGLDPIRAHSINDLIVETQRKLDITSIAVTHDLISARKIGDRVAMLSEGNIVFEGTFDELENSKKTVVKRFIHGII